jgi:hypothetical protein
MAAPPDVQPQPDGDGTIHLTEGWRVQRATEVAVSGEVLSSADIRIPAG